MIEEQLATAASNGELDVAVPLKGKPIADLDRQRSQGWWADEFVRRELSHDRRKVAEASAARSRTAFWRASDIEELAALVHTANDAIVRANVNLVAADELPLFDLTDVIDRWRRVRSAPNIRG